MENLDFNKSLRQFINKFNKDTLNILVFNNSFKSSYIYNDNYVHAIFTFKSDFIKIQCNLNSKMFDICKRFAKKIGKNVNSFNFYYGGQN